MFGKHHTLKHLSVGIAAAASIAVVAVPSALAARDTWYRNAVSQASVRPSVPFTTDTLGGNGQVTQVRGYNPQAYVYGGASPAVSKAIQARGFGRTASPPVVASVSSGTSFHWDDAGIGAGIAAGLLLLLLAGTRLRMHKRSAITA